MGYFEVHARGYRSLGVGAKALVSASLIVAAAAAPWPYQVLPLAVAVALSALTRSLSRGEARFTAGMAATIGIFTLLAYPDLAVGLPAATGMLSRVAVVALACATFARHVSPNEMTSLFERVGLGKLGFSFGLALNLTAKLRGELSVTYDAMLVRGWFRWGNLLASCAVFTRSALLGMLLGAEDVACAAEARGLSARRWSAPRPSALARLTGAALVAALGVVASASL